MGFFQGVNISGEIVNSKKHGTLDTEGTAQEGAEEFEFEGETFGEMEEPEDFDGTYIEDDYDDIDDDDDDEEEEDEPVVTHNNARTREKSDRGEAKVQPDTGKERKMETKNEKAGLGKNKEAETVIGEGCTVEGNIVCDGSVSVFGKVEGNVTANGIIVVTDTGAVYGNLDANDGNVIVNGKIKADSIRCKRADFVSAKAMCETVIAEGRVSVSNGSVVVGNIEAKEATIEGALKGNISAEGSVSVRRKAIIKGNISATSINIEPGAFVDGVLQQRFPDNVDLKSIFDEDWED